MLVRPKLQYACCTWDPYRHQKDIAALERVQRKAARFVTGNYEQTASVTSMLSELKWDSLESLRGRARLTTMYKMCYGMLEGNWGSYMIPNRESRTRGSHYFKFIEPKGNKDVFRFSFFPRTISEWNRLPSDTVLAKTVHSFKKKLT